MGTSFTDDFQPGDTLIVSISGVEEKRQVVRVQTQTQLILSSGFSQNITEPVYYKLAKAIMRVRDSTNQEHLLGDSLGNFGFGREDPRSKLDVYKDLRVGDITLELDS